MIDYVDLKPVRRSIWRAVSRVSYVLITLAAVTAFILDVQGVL